VLAKPGRESALPPNLTKGDVHQWGQNTQEGEKLVGIGPTHQEDGKGVQAGRDLNPKGRDWKVATNRVYKKRDDARKKSHTDKMREED